MRYDFDKIIDRRGTGAIKTDVLEQRYGRSDLIPIWVADMDFETPDFIREAIALRMAHPVYGYSIASKEYWDSIICWERDRHGWDISARELTFIPGIVRGISFVIQRFTEPGDKVLVLPPVYMPFLNLPRDNGRKLVYSPLIPDPVSGMYKIDFQGFEKVCREEAPKLLILSNPHNPAGVVWSKADLARMAEICAEFGILVISDEIHADMALFGNVHTPFPMASETAKRISITFGAPSKTFNIAGLVSSFAVVHDRRLREEFFGFLHANELNAPLFISEVATKAAFTKGDQWRREMLSYVEENVLFVESFMSRHLPQIKVVRPQASFLIWLDCRGLALDHDSLIDLFVNKAALALNDGEAFGPGGEGHMRMNVGCPRSVLAQALEQLKNAVELIK